MCGFMFLSRQLFTDRQTDICMPEGRVVPCMFVSLFYCFCRRKWWLELLTTAWRRWCTGQTSAHLPLAELVYKEENPSTSLNQVVPPKNDSLHRSKLIHRLLWSTKDQVWFQRILRSCLTLIFVSDLSSPEGIAIDHLGRNVFWTDSMKDRIEVSSLDGSQRRVLINTDLVNPRAILTDPTNGCVTN